MNEEIVKKITQIIKLIRSKGIGVFFISQLPSDIPDDILNQLGNRIQHCLRAYTPKELKAVKVAAESFRANPAFDTEEAILELGTGEALVSFIDETGKANGRGAYLKKDIEVIKKAKKNKILNRRLEVEIPDSIYEELESMI